MVEFLTDFAQLVGILSIAAGAVFLALSRASRARMTREAAENRRALENGALPRPPIDGYNDRPEDGT